MMKMANLVKKLICYDLGRNSGRKQIRAGRRDGSAAADLLALAKVAVISGGDWPQFQKQLLPNLPHDELLANLSILPTVERSSSATTEIGSRYIFRRLDYGRENEDREPLRKPLRLRVLLPSKSGGSHRGPGSQITF